MLSESNEKSRLKALMIVNPISGTLSKTGLEERVRASLSPAGIDVDCVHTQGAGDGFRLACEAVEKNYDAVIAAGGDGTVNEIASALRATPVALAIIPLGSGNGLVRHLYGSIDIDNALRIIADRHIEPCDYGTVNDIPFFCTFGLGFDALVSKDFSKMPSRGLTSYIRGVLKEYVRYKSSDYEIFTAGRRIKVKAFLVAVCNANQYGNNAFIAPSASVRDGMLDIVVIHSGNPLTRALAGVDLFTGRINRNLLIQTMRVRNAMIRRSSGAAHNDGDPCEMPETLRIECHPGQLRLFTAPMKKRFRPFLTPITGLHSDNIYRLKELTRRIFHKK